MASRRVAVIGAGVIGSNIAYRLSASGADVAVFEAGRPGEGTSSTSISWLSSFPQIANSTPTIVAYRRGTNDRFRALEAEIGGSWMHWTGTLTWGTGPAAERLSRDYAAMRDLDCAVRTVAPHELAELDPAIAIADDVTIYLEDGGGWVDAPALVGALLSAAAERGADIHTSEAVTGLEHRRGGWRVITAAGEFAADVVVNAAGIWASSVAALAIAPVPVDLRPGLVVYSAPLAEPLRNVLNGPEINVRPDPSGGVAIHWRGEDTYTGHGYNAADPQKVLDLAGTILPELRGATPARAAVGIRPVPPGGPVVGWHPSADGLFIAVSHGGVGWGPRWGDIAAAAILDGGEDPRWGAFSPARFFRTPEAPAPADRVPALVPAQM